MMAGRAGYGCRIYHYKHLPGMFREKFKRKGHLDHEDTLPIHGINPVIVYAKLITLKQRNLINRINTYLNSDLRNFFLKVMNTFTKLTFNKSKRNNTSIANL